MELGFCVANVLFKSEVILYNKLAGPAIQDLRNHYSKQLRYRKNVNCYKRENMYLLLYSSCSLQHESEWHWCEMWKIHKLVTHN